MILRDLLKDFFTAQPGTYMVHFKKLKKARRLSTLKKSGSGRGT
jgi:hypothetical protein